MNEIFYGFDKSRAYARVIADSINGNGDRLTSFEARFWRPVLAEFNTHCVLSRNSASSRAIPLKKMIERITDGPAEPLVWAAEQKGMQGGDEVEMHVQADASQDWDAAAESAILSAQRLGSMGIHKSIANRLLEPFMWHTAVVTATAWENFFDQRCSPMAQPEIREVAELMRQAREESTPVRKQEGEDWHLPYVADDAEACEWAASHSADGEAGLGEYYAILAKISAARCARVSYLTQDGRRDPQEDLNLYKRLVTARPAHWSPLEHVATPWLDNYQRQNRAIGFYDLDGRWVSPPTEHLPRVGKLLRWRSLRTTVEAQLGEVTYR